MPPTVAISSDTVSEAWTCIQKVMGTTVRVFWARKTIRPTAMRPATQIAVDAEAARVSGTRVAAAGFRAGLAGRVGSPAGRGLASFVEGRVVRSVIRVRSVRPDWSAP
ncbi:hypothetical protein GCM10022236_51670 [Microlunatus ginsengisoli]|uniref:Uncharacterized protein n=1 Tax=Microlunatus ginsengisoli TaxID=363863 RepID=A0ABP7AYD3_9ACTN